MAQKTIVTMVDDLTGEEAENISTVEFGIDGVTYELDLTQENSEKLRAALTDYTRAARKVGGRRRSRPRSGPATGTNTDAGGYDRETLKAVRAWAKEHGHNVSDRGRLPADVLQAWQTAQAHTSNT